MKGDSTEERGVLRIALQDENKSFEIEGWFEKLK